MRNCHITLLEEKLWWKLGKCEWRAEYMLMGIKLKEAEEEMQKKTKMETAKRLAQMGLTIDQIVKAVDASKEDVQEWITMPLR